MAPSPHVKKAFLAMEALGIEATQVKPVLKNLLAVYDKNWELIAAENYRALADAIFESQDAQMKLTDEVKGKEMKIEEAEGSAAEVDRGKKKAPESEEEDEDAMAESERPLKRLRRKGEGGSPLTLSKSTSPNLGSPSSKEFYEEDTATILLPFHPIQIATDPDAGAIGISKDELLTDMPSSSTHQDKGNSSVPMPNMEKTNGHVEEGGSETVGTVSGIANGNKLAATPEESSALELASSASGEVKINLSFAPATGGSHLHLPSMEELRRAMEEKCLRTYKILDPNFSVGGFMSDICSCYLELATKASNSANQSPEKFPFLTMDPEVLKKSAAWMPATSTARPVSINARMPVTSEGSDAENGAVGDSMGLVVVPECQVSADEWRSLSSVSDITLGEEAVEIPWVNEINDKVPPSFHYIAQSLVYLDAAVKFSLGNIRDDQCCSSCFGDCLAPSTACCCATALNGLAAYTVGGRLLQEDFLEECISEARDPQKHVMQYCKECPLEKAKKEEILEPCKGHLKRKVIKECWKKCGCTKKCGNRVVQQGIHNKLQVFFTSNGRGWGLRALEKLPKGALVCEFAGEILTIAEFFQRSYEKITSPIVLDAHWGSEQLSGDNKALCLDATNYGNVSRFINHRCSDANLIEIPIHVESMDLHYYHLGFFTTREIDAMEELTWDYGVEFNDQVFPTIPFHCRCGSELCRNIKQITKTKKKVKKRAREI